MMIRTAVQSPVESSTGTDGELTVDVWIISYTDNIQTSLTNTATGGVTTTLSVADTSSFSANGEILILQMTGIAA
jgi:hypothetical protein